MRLSWRRFALIGGVVIIASQARAVEIVFNLGQMMESGMVEIEGTTTATGIVFHVSAGPHEFLCDEFDQNRQTGFYNVECRGQGILANIDLNGFIDTVRKSGCTMSYEDRQTWFKNANLSNMELAATVNSLFYQGIFVEGPMGSSGKIDVKLSDQYCNG